MPAYQHQLEVWNNFYKWCRPHIKISEQSVALDIGCDTFGFAKCMENDFYHVHCFDFRHREQFLSRAVNDVSKFTYHNVGLGEKHDVRFTKPGVGRIKERGTMQIQIKTLDSFQIDNVAFIKIDTEGYEKKILLGSEKTIKENKPTVVIEQNRGDFEAQHLLESWGFKCVGVWEIRGKPHDYIFISDIV